MFTGSGSPTRPDGPRGPVALCAWACRRATARSGRRRASLRCCPATRRSRCGRAAGRAVFVPKSVRPLGVDEDGPPAADRQAAPAARQRPDAGICARAAAAALRGPARCPHAGRPRTPFHACPRPVHAPEAAAHARRGAACARFMRTEYGLHARDGSGARKARRRHAGAAGARPLRRASRPAVRQARLDGGGGGAAELCLCGGGGAWRRPERLARALDRAASAIPKPARCAARSTAAGRSSMRGQSRT